jgi:D-cysteine desulfhydrase
VQLEAASVPFPDHIVVACGSGGTAAGIALAVRLTGRPTKVTAIGVCDSPRYGTRTLTCLFYYYICTPRARFHGNSLDVSW